MIGVLGPEGSYSDIVRRKLGLDAKFFETVTRCLEAVEAGTVERCLVPIENSFGGTVYETVDYLIKSDLSVTGEVTMRIRHALCTAGKTGVIYSHPQAFAQCRKKLRERYPDAELVPCASTSEAAKKAAETGQSAICHEQTGRLYGLRVLETDLQNGDSNVTRFVIVSRERLESGDKTSLVFTCDDRPGALWEILGEFARRGVNLKKIDSRPTGVLGDYVFYLDLEGSPSEENVRNALEGVRSKVRFFKVIGSYRVLGEF